MRKTVKRKRNGKIKKNRRKTRGGMLSVGRITRRASGTGSLALSALNVNLTTTSYKPRVRVSSTIPNRPSTLSTSSPRPTSASERFIPSKPILPSIHTPPYTGVFSKEEQVTLTNAMFKPLYVKMLEILKEEAGNAGSRFKKSVDPLELFREGVKWTFNIPFEFIGRSIGVSVFLFLLCNSEQILEINDQLIVNTCKVFNNGVNEKKNNMMITFNCVKSKLDDTFSSVTVNVMNISDISDSEIKEAHKIISQRDI